MPSDDPDTTKGSSLFGTRSPLPSVTVNDSKPAASFSRKTEANESHSEDTETESEWEKERAQKKAQRDEEIEKVSWSSFQMTVENNDAIAAIGDWPRNLSL